MGWKDRAEKVEAVKSAAPQKASWRDRAEVAESEVAQNLRISPIIPGASSEASWLDTKLPLDTTPRGIIQGGLDALPAAGAVGGGVVGTAGAGPVGLVGGAALGTAGGYALKNLGEEFILGKPKTRTEIYGDPAMGLVEGATAEMGGQVLGKALGAGVKGLKNLGEKSAVNATGATGKQASEFSKDAGRQLLDRKVVRFGDNQEKIASRAGKAVEQAEKQIDKALKDLDAKGVTVDANKIYENVRNKITSLKKDPSQSDISKILEGELENLIAATDAKGSTKFGLSEAEGVKRGYNRKAGNWMDPEKGAAGKEMYQNFRRPVEEAAELADPNVAKLFKEGKQSYGLLAPIEEAAARRAATTQQSPAGGLLDIGAAGAGFAASGGVGAVLAPVGRRFIAPRLTSSIAVGADKTAGLMSNANNQHLLSGLIRLGLLPKTATENDIEDGLLRYQQVTEGYEQ